MASEHSLLASRSRVLIAVLPFVLAAGLVLLFDVVREIPPDYGSCGVTISDDQDAVIAAYHNGALPLHLLTLVTTLGALALLSAGRGRGPLGIGWPTLIALAVMVIMALLLLAQIPIAALIVFLPLVLVVIGFAVVAGPFGAQVTGALAALLLIGTAEWVRRGAGRGRTLVVRTALWALVVLTSAHLLLVYFQGDTPSIGC